MAEITLADLMQNSNMKTETEVSPAESAEALSVRLAALTPEERREADALRETIDMRDSQMLMQYGSGAKQNIADFSANILNNIRSKDTGYIGSLMSDLVTNVETLDFKSLEKDSGILGVFQKMEKKVKRFLAQFEKLDRTICIKQHIGNLYQDLLKNIPAHLSVSQTEYAKNHYWIFGIVLNDDVKFNAKTVINKLAGENIETRPFFFPLQTEENYHP